MRIKLHMIKGGYFLVQMFDNKGGVRVDENDFILVDLNKEGYPDDQFIWATQAKQVFFM